jgi:hypothetical protein
MIANELIHNHLEKLCPSIYMTRLDAVMDVALSLQKSKNLSLTEMGRNLVGEGNVKHRIKKVDRLEGNKHLHNELNQIYMGLSDYVFSLISQDKNLPIIVDLCFMKDDIDIQMLSAEVASKGRTIPLYREVFNAGELKNRADSFITKLSACVPTDRNVIIIMDAGFHEDWLKAIEAQNWYWICRTRTGKSFQFSGEKDWISVKEFIPKVNEKTKDHGNILLTSTHQHPCRLITTHNKHKKSHRNTPRALKTRNNGAGSYLQAAKEPWILTTNLPSRYKSTEIVTFYSKRMQIEESFRDIKSHQFGLCGRYVRTTCIHRWGVKMMLAAIAQIVYWVLGIIGHSQGMQRLFQANTVRDKKVFSYFTLGRFIIEYDKLDKITIDHENLPKIIQKELACA